MTPFERALHQARSCHWNNRYTKMPTVLCILCAKDAITAAERETKMGVLLNSDNRAQTWKVSAISASSSHVRTALALLRAAANQMIGCGVDEELAGLNRAIVQLAGMDSRLNDLSNSLEQILEVTGS